MHDLNTINRLNREAFAGSVDKFRAQGRWVLACYDGLHLVSIETFSTADEAGPAFAAAHATVGEHAKLLPPTLAWYASQRDQSEDRVVHVVGVKAPPVTLTDYIEAVQQSERS